MWHHFLSQHSLSSPSIASRWQPYLTSQLTARCFWLFSFTGLPPYGQVDVIGGSLFLSKRTQKLTLSVWHRCQVWHITLTINSNNNEYIHRAPDKVRKMNFNWLYLCHFFIESYVWPLVRIVSMRRFWQVVKQRIWWKTMHFRTKNTHFIWSPVYSQTCIKGPQKTTDRWFNTELK